jgi:lysozyme
MNISNVGLAIVKSFEGCLKPVPNRPGFFKPYYCPANVLTVGYGHTNHHKPHFTANEIWSQATCDAVLKTDMAIFERHVRAQAPTITDQHQFDALVSWSFNTGGPATSSVWTYASKGDVAGTVERLQRWNQANGQVLKGLVRRRKCEGELFAGEPAKALVTAGWTGPMPQRVDRPTVPAKEVARHTKGATTAAAGGAAATAGGASTEQTASIVNPANVAIAIGLVMIVVAIIVIARKRKQLNADWA